MLVRTRPLDRNYIGFARNPTRIAVKCGSPRWLVEAPMLMRHRRQVNKACSESETNAWLPHPIHCEEVR
jgi:hypothetical protein